MTATAAALLTIVLVAGTWTAAHRLGRAARRKPICRSCRRSPALPGVDECERCWLEEGR